MTDIPASFDAAFRDFYEIAFSVAARATTSIEHTEDLSTDALARALNSWDRIDTSATRRAEIVRLTIEEAIVGSRRGRRSSHQWSELTLAVRALPRRLRRIAALRLLGSLGPDEIAAVLGIDPAVVVTQLCDTFARLPDHLLPVEAIHAA